MVSIYVLLKAINSPVRFVQNPHMRVKISSRIVYAISPPHHIVTRSDIAKLAMTVSLQDHLSCLYRNLLTYRLLEVE